MTRQPTNLVRERAEIAPQGSVLTAGKARQEFHLIRQLVRAPIRQFRNQLDFSKGQVECLADFADALFRVAKLCGAVATNYF